MWIETHISVFTIYETHRDGDDGDRETEIRLEGCALPKLLSQVLAQANMLGIMNNVQL